MANSRCSSPGCGSTRFEVVGLSAPPSKFMYSAVQCATCGTVVGVVDQYYVSDLILRLAAKLNVAL